MQDYDPSMDNKLKREIEHDIAAQEDDRHTKKRPMDPSVRRERFSIAETLKARRVELGLTQEELAQRLGVRQPHIARMETLGPGSLTLLIKAVNSLNLQLSIEPAYDFNYKGPIGVKPPLIKRGETPLTPFEVKPGNIRAKVFTDDAGDEAPYQLCPNGHLLTPGRNKCSVKGCKYA